MSKVSDPNKTVVIDIDGVLVYWDKHSPNHIKGDIDQAKASLMRLRRQGLIIHLYTSRPVEEKESLSKALKERGFVFDFLTCGKPLGFAYIDDRAVRFTDWGNALKWVSTLQRVPFYDGGGTKC